MTHNYKLPSVLSKRGQPSFCLAHLGVGRPHGHWAIVFHDNNIYNHVNIKGIITKVSFLKVNKVNRVCVSIGMGIISSSQQVQIMKIVISSFEYRVQMHKL